MDSVNQEVAKDMIPTHEIDVDIKLEANVEGHVYKVDAQITFKIDLNSILSTENASAQVRKL